MRSFLIIIFICMVPVFGWGQQQEIDSFLSALKMHPAEDTARIHLLTDISFDYYQLDPDRGISFADEAIALSKKLKSDFWLGVSLFSRGLNHTEKGQYTIALDFYKQALALLEKEKSESKSFAVRNSIAVVYMRLSEFSRSLELYFQNLSSSERMNNERAIALSAGNIAITYENMGNYRLASIYNQRAIDIQRKRKDKKAVADLLNTRGNIFDSKGESATAIDFYRESSSICKELNYVKGVASANSNLANVYTALGLYDSAFYYIKKPLEFYRQTGDKYNSGVLLGYMGNIITKASNGFLLKEGIAPAARYNLALDYHQQSLKLYKEIENVSGQSESWLSISNDYKVLNKFDRALQAHEKYVNLKDSVLSDEKMEEIKKTELQYAVKKNEDSLLLIQEKKDVETLGEINRQNTMRKAVLWGSGILFLSAFITFIFYKKRRDARQKQQEAEFKTEVADTEMKALRAQMNPHFIFNSLNSIGDYIGKNDVQQANRYLSKFAKLMRMILENSEQKDVPLTEDLKALELYMQLEALRMNNKFSYEIKIDDNLDKDVVMVPPLLLQPFVENSIWHGIAGKEGPGKILIHIKKDGKDMINCIVEDDGIGRKQSALVKTTAAQPEKTSLGMKITQARIDILNKIKNTNAAVKLSDLEQGVRVEVQLPLAVSF